MVVAGACWFSGQVSEASWYVQVPAELGVALTGLDAAQWLALMWMNDIGRARRTCRTQDTGYFRIPDLDKYPVIFYICLYNALIYRGLSDLGTANRVFPNTRFFGKSGSNKYQVSQCLLSP